MTKLLKKISIAAIAIIAAGMLYIPVSAADTATVTISDGVSVFSLIAGSLYLD